MSNELEFAKEAGISLIENIDENLYEDYSFNPEIEKDCISEGKIEQDIAIQATQSSSTQELKESISHDDASLSESDDGSSVSSSEDQTINKNNSISSTNIKIDLVHLKPQNFRQSDEEEKIEASSPIVNVSY